MWNAQKLEDEEEIAQYDELSWACSLFDKKETIKKLVNRAYNNNGRKSATEQRFASE